MSDKYHLLIYEVMDQDARLFAFPVDEIDEEQLRILRAINGNALGAYVEDEETLDALSYAADALCENAEYCTRREVSAVWLPYKVDLSNPTLSEPMTVVSVFRLSHIW